MLYALVSPANVILEYRPYATEPEGLAVAASKPRLLPVIEVPVDFDPATQVLLEPVDTVEPQRVRRANGVRLKTEDELAADRAGVIAAIKAEASRRIQANYPLWRQINMTARAVSLIDLRSQRDLTEPEMAEQDALRAAWVTVDAIRTRSDELEAALPSDPAELSAFDPLAGWD